MHFRPATEALDFSRSSRLHTYMLGLAVEKRLSRLGYRIVDLVRG